MQENQPLHQNVVSFTFLILSVEVNKLVVTNIINA